MYVLLRGLRTYFFFKPVTGKFDSGWGFVSINKDSLGLVKRTGLFPKSLSKYSYKCKVLKHFFQILCLDRIFAVSFICQCSIFVAKFSYSLSYNELANNVLVVDITSNDDCDKTVFALIHLVYFHMRIPIKD